MAHLNDEVRKLVEKQNSELEKADKVMYDSERELLKIGTSFIAASGWYKKAGEAKLSKKASDLAIKVNKLIKDMK